MSGALSWHRVAAHLTRREPLSAFARALMRAYKGHALLRQDGLCLYCHSRLRLRDATAEHAVPRSRGGGTTIGNIDAACAGCNTAKGDRTRPEFNRAIHEPDLHRDGWDLYLACAEIRLKRRAALACTRLRSIIEARP